MDSIGDVVRSGNISQVDILGDNIGSNLNITHNSTVMTNIKPKICWVQLEPTSFIPTRGTPMSAGFDLYADINTQLIISPNKRMLVPTNIGAIFPPNTYGRVVSRSSVAYKHQVDVCAGIIDNDYRNSIGVVLHNHSTNDFIINRKDRIAQIIIEYCHTDATLDAYSKCLDDAKLLPEWDTSRIGGFGSTGK